MLDIKKMLQRSAELGIYETIGELYSHSFLENEVLFKEFQGTMFKKSRECHEELKKYMSIWKNNYGFDENTKIVDVLKVI